MGMNDRKHANVQRKFFKKTAEGAMLSLKLAQELSKIIAYMPLAIIGTTQTVGIGIS